MSNENKLIPELRFSEFENEGEWEEKRISQLGDTVNGLTGKSGEDFGTGKPYVTYKQVFANSIIDFDKCGKVQISESENQNTLKKGDILLTTSSETPNEVGYASVIVESPIEPTYLNSFCFSIRPFDIEETQPRFSRYLFHSPVYRKSVSALAQGSTRYNLSKGAFLNLKLPLPKPQEQQKIANCLSSLDEVIAAHSQKLDLLKDHKKGLMQNLFPQEGEKVPKYRFKEFEKKWEKVKLKDVSTYFNGGSYENDVKEDGKYELITLKSINKYGQLVNSNRYIDIEVATLSIGTLVMILSEQAPGLLGMTAIIPENNKYVLNQRVAEIRPNQKVISFFLSMAINRNQVYFSKQGAGMKVQNITKPNVENYEFLVPEINEQQKIASCLSSLDALITAQAEKIEQLKLHKKGLMQGLFPKIEI